MWKVSRNRSPNNLGVVASEAPSIVSCHAVNSLITKSSLAHKTLGNKSSAERRHKSEQLPL